MNLNKTILFKKDVTKKQLVESTTDLSSSLDNPGIGGSGWNIQVSNTDSLYRLQFTINDEVVFYLTEMIADDATQNVHGISIPAGNTFQIAETDGLPFFQVSSAMALILNQNVIMQTNNLTVSSSAGDPIMTLASDGSLSGSFLTWLDSRYLNTPSNKDNFYRYNDTPISPVETTTGYAYNLPFKLGLNDFMVCQFRVTLKGQSNLTPLMGIADVRTLAYFYDDDDQQFWVEYGMDTVNGVQRIYINPVDSANKPEIAKWLLVTIKVLWGLSGE